MYKVYLVDDEPFIIEGLYDIIDWENLGLEIIGHADNGLRALEALKQLPVDILITDISMPTMNGLELIRAVRNSDANAHLNELKIIILSGYDEFEYLKEGMKLGIENYLLKPIDVQEFQETLITMIDKINSVTTVRSPVNDQDVRIIKDHIMHRWLTGKIKPHEFEERAELLQLQMDRKYIMVVLFRCQDEEGDSCSAVSEVLVDDVAIIPFHNTDGDQIFVCMMDDPIPGKLKAMELLSTFQHLCANCQASIGSIQRLSDGAQLSYLHAKKVQQYTLLFPDRAILDYEEINNETEQVSLELPWTEYSKLVLDRNKDELLAQIEHDFTQMLQSQNMTPNRVQQIAIEIVIRFKMELDSIRLEDCSMLFQEALGKVMEAKTVSEVADVIKGVAAMTIESSNGKVRSPVIQQVLKVIHSNYDKDLSLKILSRQFNIHPVYLGHLFQKETGEGFTEYMNKYRIGKAKSFLKDTHLKVHEISKKVGYWEISYFNRQFKKYTGMSPTEYKGL